MERSDTKEKLKFLHSVLAPFFEAYFVTAHHIGEVIDNEQPGEIFFIQTSYCLFHYKFGITGPVAQYVASLTADPGVASLILAQPHTFWRLIMK